MSNIVAIVGRPNVGKSTLFNRLTESRQAITNNEPGVTRDRHYGLAEWLDKSFTVIDTGGYVVGSEDVFEEAIRKQVSIAIEEANVILFVVDTMEGLNPLDKEFAKILRRSKKPVFVVANKAETPERNNQAQEFYELGLDNIFPISAETGSGTGDLLDAVAEHLEPEHTLANEGLPRIAILGRPNVGKSSFLNILVGSDRSIVTDIAGTTRDAIDTHYNLYGKEFVLTDTAGLRKKTKVKEDIEFFSVMRSLRTLEASDVCLLLLDATQGLESQDLNILRLAEKHKKGMLIMVNKWDLIEKDTKTAKTFEDAIRKKIAPMDYIPIIFTSVLEKKRIYQSIEKALEVYENRQKHIPTSQLNEVMLAAIEKYPPPFIKGKYVKIKYVTQLPTKTPTFAFFCNLPQYVQESYQRYLENQLRKSFNFEGVPIQLFFRKK
ncbi:MAG: ribosome biogenesis GTPase Der [Thermonemataceae bacterium]|nr:ribosome biogenesis GTPase Der [Thermonemataceae bacterium]